VALAELGGAYLEVGKRDEAIKAIEQAASRAEKRGLKESSDRAVLAAAVDVYEKTRRFTDAEKWRRKSLAALAQTRQGAGSLEYAAELEGLGRNLANQKKWAEAEAALREALTVREKVEPESWRTAAARTQLAETILEQKKGADAEPLLLQGFEELKSRQAQAPKEARTAMRLAANRLLNYYADAKRFDLHRRWLAEWQKLLVDDAATKPPTPKQKSGGPGWMTPPKKPPATPPASPKGATEKSGPSTSAP
jgi:tetratricopeptide (TPR) repeat protein